LRYSGRPDLELQSGNISSLAKHELATPSTLTGLLLTSNNQGPVSDGVEETVHALFDGHIRQLTVDSSPTGYGLFVLEDLLLELMDFLVFCVDCVSVSKIVVLEGVDLMIMSTDLGDEASLLLIQCVFAIGNISGITWDVSVLLLKRFAVMVRGRILSTRLFGLRKQIELVPRSSFLAAILVGRSSPK
jgi:hypothetical protein